MDKDKIKDILLKEIPENQVFIDEPMKKHTSFKIGGPADILVKVKNIKELQYVIELAKKKNISLTVIGNGSNLLVKDNGIRGIVIQLDFTDIKIDKNIITVGAGVKLAELAQIALKQGLSGLEFAAGIPGSIGGAVYMNAGAHGKEMKDIVLETVCLDVETYEKKVETIHIDDIEIIEEHKEKILPEIIKLSNYEQNFSYRHSIFMDKKYIVLETKLALQKENEETIKQTMQEYLCYRKERQPIDMPSAGSVFKRGEDFISAKLIDECGLKGYTIGGAQVSTKHAGFIVNTGEATAKDVIKLIEFIEKTVYNKTGKKIELEIEILGE